MGLWRKKQLSAASMVLSAAAVALPVVGTLGWTRWPLVLVSALTLAASILPADEVDQDSVLRLNRILVNDRKLVLVKAPSWRPLAVGKAALGAVAISAQDAQSSKPVKSLYTLDQHAG